MLTRTSGRGADVVIEAAGRIEAFPEGMDLLAIHGCYVIMRLYSGRATTPLDPVRINNRNLSIIGSLGTAMHTAAMSSFELQAQQSKVQASISPARDGDVQSALRALEQRGNKAESVEALNIELLDSSQLARKGIGRDLLSRVLVVIRRARRAPGPGRRPSAI